MKLSAPIFRLKKQAKALVRARGIALHDALDQIAKSEGYASWSLLAAKHRLTSISTQILGQFLPGDLVLLGGRPNEGKTAMGLSLMVDAARSGKRSIFFSLYYTELEVRTRLLEQDMPETSIDTYTTIDASDNICAPYVAEKLCGIQPGTIVVIDYMQILDQRRESPPLNEQIGLLKTTAAETGAIIVLISQIKRDFELIEQQTPSLPDVHLPNPVDLSLFTKTCFLSNGHIELAHAA